MRMKMIAFSLLMQALFFIAGAALMYVAIKGKAPATEAGDTGYYSSPQVTRPALEIARWYEQCPLVFKKKDGTYYAKVTVCYRA